MRYGTGTVFEQTQETPMVKSRNDELLLAKGLAEGGVVNSAKFKPINRKERRIAASQKRRKNVR